MKRSRVWTMLAVLLLANYLLLFAQTAIANWAWRHRAPVSFFFPEVRYWLQGCIVFLPLVPMALLRFRHGGKILAVLLAACAVHAVAMLAKPHVPAARRHQVLGACDWAVETIRADYRGPKADAEPLFSWLEYHSPARPCVEAHVARVGYLLGGRCASLAGCGLADTPDYIVDEPRRAEEVRGAWAEAGVAYEKFAERTFGRREFVIYRRVK